MKKFMMASLAALAVALGTQAVASTLKVKFEDSKGVATIVTFNNETKTYTSDSGETGTYTLDEAAKKICFQTSKGDMCGVSPTTVSKVGDTTTITNADGSVAKVTVIE